ncbi:MAG: UDP-N-acetylmuramoylalanine--D-glutamate ligase [Phycisphaerae bacterium]|nr:UDP-N-acetylmuramoylalanine--D-glutamate ligase [Phycisphaerae bacterium]
MSDFRNQHVVVMGLGRFGGGVGVTRWLAEQGAKVVVTDLSPAEQLQKSMAKLEGLQIEYHLGSHPESLLDDAQLLVVSPAVDKSKAPFVEAARRRRIPISSEMNLFFERCPARIIGITGSLGKSTSTAMIFDMLHALRPTLPNQPPNIWLGGNIGVSLLSDLPDITPQDLVVLELSSFQLDDLDAIPRSPFLAVLTYLMPQHLDRHGTYHSYIRTKLKIFTHQTAADYAVVSESAWSELEKEGFDTLYPQHRTEHRPIPQMHTYALADQLAGQLAVLGSHNLANAAAALTVGRILGLDETTCAAELKKFRGLPHRLEFIREYEGVRYYDDSKATTPEAVITALQALEDYRHRLVLLAGGYNKNFDFTRLSEAICDHTRAVIFFGECRSAMQQSLRELEGRRMLPTIKTVHDFRGGINLARRLAKPGEIVLLSPGHPSYDEFANYEERGDAFRQMVTGWI